MNFKNLIFFVFILCCVCLSAQERIYFNDFEVGDLNVDEYVGDPIISEHISFSVWTNNAGGFVEQPGVNDSRAISILGNGTKSIFFTIEIEDGFQLDITGYKFWAKKTKANQGWTFLMNGVEYANGQTEFEGSFIEGDFPPALLNQTGTIDVEFRVNGMGNGNYILDDFEFFGAVSPICDQPLIETQPDDETVCSGDEVEFFVQTIAGDIIAYQWQILIDGDWVNLANDENYSGVNTDTLLVENTPIAFDQNNYRCVVIVDGCEEVSNGALLTVIALPSTDPILYNN